MFKANSYSIPPQMLTAALAGFGLSYVPEDLVREPVAEGRLVQVLEDWCPINPGYHLYYPSRRQSSPAFALVRDVPLAHVIRDEVLASILRGDFKPGDRITEPMIASKLGVSRVPVREALRDLEAMGLLESRKHAGVLVRQLSAKETAELYELRSVLDAFAGRVAASSPDPALIAVLEKRLASMDEAAQAKDVMAYYEANIHFHWDIIHASGNSQLIDIYRGVVQKLHLARLRNLSTDVGILNSLKEHHAMVEAIRRGQADTCEKLMASHVRAAGKRLEKILFEGDNSEEKGSA